MVKAGSAAVSIERETPSFAVHLAPVHKMRHEIIARGVLRPEGDHLIFAQDYTFNSPSLAAAIVIGGSANGRIEWKDKNGRTLKELQELQSKVTA